MRNGDVLQPFAPQDYRWDDLWLEQDQGKALREFTQKLLSIEFSDVDKAAVKEVCAFFMNLKKNTRLFQQHVAPVSNLSWTGLPRRTLLLSPPLT